MTIPSTAAVEWAIDRAAIDSALARLCDTACAALEPRVRDAVSYSLLGGGKREFDEIYVEPEAKPPIVLDGKADDVFAAIIEKKYRALSFWDPQLVAAWSHYVISDGPLPVRPQPHRSPNPVGPPEAA